MAASPLRASTGVDRVSKPIKAESPTSPIDPPVKPEKSTNYEIGFKIARPRLRIEGAIFYTDFTDLQTSTVVQDPITHRLSTTVINAKGAENYGGELSVAYTPVADLNVHAGVGHTHARYKKFPNASVNLIDGDHVLTNQIEDFSGLQIERAPDWTANLGLDYTAISAPARSFLPAAAIT